MKLLLSVVLLLTSQLQGYAQLSEEAARQRVVEVVRSKLNIRPAQFLGIKRHEELEEMLAVATNGHLGMDFVYTLSPVGYEFTEHGIIEHMSTDGEGIYVVVIDRANGGTYAIRGFSDSLAEFKRLMLAVNMKVASPGEAESLAKLYQAVNPEQFSFTPVSDLLDLKQAAERQCRVVSFDLSERHFGAWWNHAKALYGKSSFKQTATQNANGYAVEWVVLSSPGPSECAGTPLRAQLQIGRSGEVGKLTFVLLESR